MRICILAAVVLSSTIGLMPSALAQTTSQEQSMSEMMRGPKSTELFPTLIRISEPDPVERARLERRAEQWMSEGISLVSEGAAALSESTQRDDVRAMEQAGATIRQGLSRLESGPRGSTRTRER